MADELNKLFSVCDNLSIQLEDVLAENEKLKMDRVDASGVIAQALKISAKDQDTLKILRRDLGWFSQRNFLIWQQFINISIPERAWRATDAANARDESKDETLQAVLKKYEALVKKTKAQEMEMEPEEIAGLGKFKDTVVFECERLTAEVFELNKRLLIQRHYSDALTKKVEESENNFKDLYKKLDDLFNESFKEKKELERLKLLHDVLLGEKVILEDNLQHYMTRVRL